MENITKEQAIAVLENEKKQRLEVAQKEFKLAMDKFCQDNKCQVVPTVAVVGNQILQSGFQIILND